MTGIINGTLKPPQGQKEIRLQVYNTLALLTLLYGCETWVIREEDKSRITPKEMRFMNKRTKAYGAITNSMKILFSELKINPVANKIQNKLVQQVRRMYRDRQTATLNYEMSTVWETRSRTTPQNPFGLLMGPEEVTRPETL
jgi:hypothetical protein